MEYFSKPTKAFLTALAGILVLGAGWVDYIAGPEYSLLLLYLIPVMTTAWFVGKWAAVAVSVASAVVLLSVDLVWQKHSSGSVALYWNDFSNLLFFLLVTYIIASLKSAFEREKLAAGTDALTGVANRKHFYELADAEINRLRRYGRPFTICCIGIGTIMGIPIRVHFSWFIIVGLITWSLSTFYFPQAAPDLPAASYWVKGVLASLLLFASVCFHELSHAFVAKKYNIPSRASRSSYLEALRR